MNRPIFEHCCNCNRLKRIKHMNLCYIDDVDIKHRLGLICDDCQLRLDKQKRGYFKLEDDHHIFMIG